MDSTDQMTQKWLDRVRYDLDTATAMLQARRYIYVIFMCQQAVEKCLKALISYQQKEVYPIHNLRRLAEVAGIIEDLDEPILLKLDFLSRYYLDSRYKEDIRELARGITESLSQEFVRFAEEMIQWLCQKMKS